jgi:8-oxo-dGTP pyrophosphatase MutT (NUDIX family)
MKMRRLPLPDSLVEQARRYDDGSVAPAEPRNAATVVLMRGGASSPEVYLLQRQTSMEFAAGMCVFPGGGVDPRDSDHAVAWAGPSPETWAKRLGVEEELARALVCAAVRETFEESGVLLAGESAGSVVADTTGDDWEADRVALEARELAMTDFLDRRGLVLRSDLLGTWAGWLTPIFEPRRYRTWFFVAELPEGQRTRDVSSESSRVLWMSAGDAVAAVDDGRMLMLPPTYLTCLELAAHATPAAVLAACADRDVEMFMPEVVDDGEGFTLSRPARIEPLLEEHFS